MARKSKIARKASKMRQKVQIKAAKQMGRVNQKIAKFATKERIKRIKKRR
jgi:hypothetical protein